MTHPANPTVHPLMHVVADPQDGSPMPLASLCGVPMSWTDDIRLRDTPELDFPEFCPDCMAERGRRIKADRVAQR